MAVLPSPAERVENPYRLSVSAMIIRMSSVSSTTRTFFMQPVKVSLQIPDPLVEALGRLVDAAGGGKDFVGSELIAVVHQVGGGIDDAGQRRAQFARQHLGNPFAQFIRLLEGVAFQLDEFF